MKGSDLKRMSRRELLELLIAQATETEKLKQDLEQAQAALRDKRITVEKAGSLADAAMQLSGVFEAAQDAARMYLENLRLMNEQREQAVQAVEAEARKKAEAVIMEAVAYSREAHRAADAYVQKARAEADAYRQQASGQAAPLPRKQGDPQSSPSNGKDNCQ